MQSANTRDLQHSVTQTIKKLGSSQLKGVKKLRYGCPPGSDAGTEGARGATALPPLIFDRSGYPIPTRGGQTFT